MRAIRRSQVLSLGILCLTFAGFTVAADPEASAPNESVKGETKELQDLKLTPVKVRSKTLPCMYWADAKGTALYTLDPAGVIQRISYPELKVTKKIDVDKKCAWLASSSEGLVLSVAELQEVWVLDPETGKVKRKTPVPNLARAVSAATLPVAFAQSREDLFVIDLVKGTSSKYTGTKPKLGVGGTPVISPDGKNLITRAFEAMHRYTIKGDKLSFAQSGPRIAQGRVDIGVQFSPDSKFVALPCYAGNYGAKQNGIFVYPVTNLERPEASLEFGGPGTMAFSADPASGKFYTYGSFPQFCVFDGEGKLQKNYKVDAGEAEQILVHPAGGSLLLMGTGKFYVIELPK